MCRTKLLFYYVPYVLLLPAITLQLFFRFRAAQRFARNILNHQTFEQPSLGNFRKDSVPSAFVDCLEKALSSEIQKELNLSLNYARFPAKVVRKSTDVLIEMFRPNLYASRNLKNDCNDLLRVIKVHTERSKRAARLYT